MRSYLTPRFAQYHLAPAFRLTVLLLCLSVSAPVYSQALTQNQQQIVAGLNSTSGAVTGQFSLATAYSSALQSAATAGSIVDPTAHQQATITDAQRQSYNTALGAFNAASFYSAQQLFTARANQSIAAMNSAIQDFAAASVDIQRVTAVNQLVQTATDAPKAKAVQDAIRDSGLATELTGQHVAAFNQSLGAINAASSQAAAFFRAANSQNIAGNVDNFAAQYNKDLAYATATFDYASGAVAVAWADGLATTQQGVLNQYKVSSDEFFRAVTGAAQ